MPILKKRMANVGNSNYHKKILITNLVVLVSLNIFLQTYVSPTGNAAFNGADINNPTTLVHAISLLNSTTTTPLTIYLRGGTYTLTAGISLASSRSGTATNIKNLLAYSGDARPILDFSGVQPRATTSASGARGITFSPSYWLIKGVDFASAPNNGLFVSASNNTIENCAFYRNQDTGL